ncbi:hypothetical protein LTR50_000740 [Elasticomyces elasticus]|nr:hypothetical protein LTR50_000740 [Elasticomyces elasticus]
MSPIFLANLNGTLSHIQNEVTELRADVFLRFDALEERIVRLETLVLEPIHKSIFLDIDEALPSSLPIGYPHIIDIEKLKSPEWEANEYNSAIHTVDVIATLLHHWNPEKLAKILDETLDYVCYDNYCKGEDKPSGRKLCIERNEFEVTVGMMRPGRPHDLEWDPKVMYHIINDGEWRAVSGSWWDKGSCNNIRQLEAADSAIAWELMRWLREDREPNPEGNISPPRMFEDGVSGAGSNEEDDGDTDVDMKEEEA